MRKTCLTRLRAIAISTTNYDPSPAGKAFETERSSQPHAAASGPNTRYYRSFSI